MKTSKKLITSEESIRNAETKLEITYPQPVRERLREQNGFEWGGFTFFCVLDNDDIKHTFDDIVRENTNSSAGWLQYLPKGNVAIADDGGQGCLSVNTNKDGKVYYWNNDLGELSTFAENDEQLITLLDKTEEDFL